MLKRYPEFLTRGGVRLRGLLYGVPLLPVPMIEDQEAAVGAIARGVHDLAERGARAVGLGALCAVVGSRGRAVADRCDVPVTTGHELTAWAAVRTAERVSALLGRRPDAPVAVLGLPWVVATAVAEVLGRGEREVLVHGLSDASAKRLLKRAPGLTPVGHEEAFERARLIVSASSNIDGLFSESQLAPGSVVVDVARPRDLKGPRTRGDILSVDGETVSLPSGTKLGAITEVYNRIVGQGTTDVFACFAAPMLAALGGLPEPMSEGRFIDPDVVQAWGRVAEHEGFHVDALFDRGRRLDSEALRGWGAQYPGL